VHASNEERYQAEGWGGAVGEHDSFGWKEHRTAAIAGGAALFLLFLAIVAWSTIRIRLEPIARARIVDNLEYKLRCKVELDQVHVSLTHGLEVNGTGLRIMSIGNRQRATPGGVPMLTVRSFQFTSTLGDLIFHHASAVTAYAQGLVITLPAANDREPLDQQNPDPAKRNQPRDSLLLNKLVATDSSLVLENSDPAKDSIVFPFNKLVLSDPGKNQPFVYDSILENPKPIGQIHSVGHIGPWVFTAPRQTPVDGNYTFDHTDLSSVTGLNGTLTSAGRITGVLGAMAVHGTTETPDFSLDISARPFAVHTEFQALVDGTTGDVALQAVEAKFLKSTLHANGLISRSTTKVPGHNIAIDVHMARGRGEDLLTLFSKSSPPLLYANMTLNGHVEVPPGKERLVMKMRARGTASLAGARWSSESVQQNVNTLSQRAEDNAKQAMKDPAANPLVTSTMTGTFAIQNGNIDISGLVYKMPGTVLLMDGTYPLVDHDLDFHGVARTVATASQMETGWKSLLLKPVSPFLKKKGAGMQIPVSFSGPKSGPHFALDLKNRKIDDAKTADNSVKPKP
jgi:hypothetical protein